MVSQNLPFGYLWAPKPLKVLRRSVPENTLKMRCQKIEKKLQNDLHNFDQSIFFGSFLLAPFQPWPRRCPRSQNSSIFHKKHMNLHPFSTYFACPWWPKRATVSCGFSYNNPSKRWEVPSSLFALRGKREVPSSLPPLRGKREVPSSLFPLRGKREVLSSLFLLRGEREVCSLFPLPS